jgi:hypothetical protein
VLVQLVQFIIVMSEHISHIRERNIYIYILMRIRRYIIINIYAYALGENRHNFFPGLTI